MGTGCGSREDPFASENPESDIQTLYDMNRQEAIQAAFR